MQCGIAREPGGDQKGNYSAPGGLFMSVRRWRYGGAKVKKKISVFEYCHLGGS